MEDGWNKSGENEKAKGGRYYVVEFISPIYMISEQHQVKGNVE